MFEQLNIPYSFFCSSRFSLLLFDPDYHPYNDSCGFSYLCSKKSPTSRIFVIVNFLANGSGRLPNDFSSVV